MTAERLQKLMARAGLGSRRSCEEMIRLGRVSVNGQVATLGMQADPSVQQIRVDGVELQPAQAPIYIMLNKPRGAISDEDVTGRLPRAREMIPVGDRLYPVGRLDVQSEGLMLFTNDGALAHKLTHPSFEHPKTYLVTVEGDPDETTLNAWRRGIVLDDKRTGPAQITRRRSVKGETTLEITVREGRKRQLRRIAAALGHPVRRLLRIKLGPLELGNLQAGAWRALTDEEIAALRVIRAQSPRRRPRRQLDQRTRRTLGGPKNVSHRRAPRQRESRRR